MKTFLRGPCVASLFVGQGTELVRRLDVKWTVANFSALKSQAENSIPAALIQVALQVVSSWVLKIFSS